MSTSHRFNMIVLGVMGLGITFTSASSRPWKATPIQIAGDYAHIDHQKSSTESVNITWWAPPTVMSGTPLYGILEKYIVVYVIHAHVNQGGTFSFDDTDALEARDGGDKPLTLVITVPWGTDDGFNCLAPNGSIVDCKDRTRNAMPTVEGTVDSFNCLAPDGSIVDCKDRAR